MAHGVFSFGITGDPRWGGFPRFEALEEGRGISHSAGGPARAQSGSVPSVATLVIKDIVKNRWLIDG